MVWWRLSREHCQLHSPGNTQCATAAHANTNLRWCRGKKLGDRLARSSCCTKEVTKSCYDNNLKSHTFICAQEHAKNNNNMKAAQLIIWLCAQTRSYHNKNNDHNNIINVDGDDDDDDDGRCLIMITVTLDSLIYRYQRLVVVVVLTCCRCRLSVARVACARSLAVVARCRHLLDSISRQVSCYL